MKAMNSDIKFIKTEALAYWFLRLNGFLTIPNFVVHPDNGKQQRTDVDILGCRFPYRKELLHSSMRDFDTFTTVNQKPLIAIVEVKKQICSINNSWLEREHMNMERIVCAIGIAPNDNIPEIVNSLYATSLSDNKFAFIKIICIGNRPNCTLSRRYPLLSQITWLQIKKFIFLRFTEYREQKLNHSQWDDEGKILWECFDRSTDESEFCENIVEID